MPLLQKLLKTWKDQREDKEAVYDFKVTGSDPLTVPVADRICVKA